MHRLSYRALLDWDNALSRRNCLGSPPCTPSGHCGPGFLWCSSLPPSELCPGVLFCLGFCLPVFPPARSLVPGAVWLVLGLSVHLSVPGCPGLDILGTLLPDLVLLTWSHQPLATRCLRDAMSHRVGGEEIPASWEWRLDLNPGSTTHLL